MMTLRLFLVAFSLVSITVAIFPVSPAIIAQKVNLRYANLFNIGDYETLVEELIDPNIFIHIAETDFYAQGKEEFLKAVRNQRGKMRNVEISEVDTNVNGDITVEVLATIANYGKSYQYRTKQIIRNGRISTVVVHLIGIDIE